MTPGQPSLELGTGTNILMFPAGHERQCQKHISLTSHLKGKRVYPALRVFLLKASHPQARCPQILVVTGSAEETRKLGKIFYTREAEEFVRDQCGNDWNAINPASSVANVADSGSSVDMSGFNAMLQQIRDGYYQLEKEIQ